jgi:hypothetical protein
MRSKLSDLINSGLFSGMNMFSCWRRSDTAENSPISTQISTAPSIIDPVEVVTLAEKVDTQANHEPIIDPAEKKRLKDKEYGKRYRDKKRKSKEEQKARQIILDFKKQRETSTPEQINAFILEMGQSVSDILQNLIGEQNLDLFTFQYAGRSRLDMIDGKIKYLEDIVNQIAEK